MDTVKLIARNIHFEALEVFRGYYDNLRDDATNLRELLRCDGILGEAGQARGDVAMY